jgi:SAM-dependent methyltransferase
MPMFDQAAAWDQVSAVYQERSQILTDDLYYGPWAPAESTLSLLGDVRGLRVLDLGCGGGQAAIYLARQGALTTGLDISQQQLAVATRQANQAGVSVRWVVGGLAELALLPVAQWDLIISIYALHYMRDLPRCLAECYQRLRPGGRLLFSLDHPIHACFFDPAEQEPTLYPERSYFDATPCHWLFPDTRTQMESYHYTIGQWFDLLQTAGFRLLRLIEPPPPPTLVRELWPDDDPFSPMRNLPHSIIFCAGK